MFVFKWLSSTELQLTIAEYCCTFTYADESLVENECRFQHRIRRFVSFGPFSVETDIDSFGVFSKIKSFGRSLL